MASPIRNFFLGGEKSKPPRKPSGSELFGYARVKPKKFKGGGSPERGFIEKAAEGIGKSAVRGGPFGAVLEWAGKQTDKDLREFWWVPLGKIGGEKISAHPIKAPLHPVKTAEQFAERGVKGFVRGVAWAMVQGAVIEKDRLEWLSIRDELESRFAGSPVDRKLLERFDRALTEPGSGEEMQEISDEMIGMARNRFGPQQDDPVVKRFGSLAESSFERQQFFSGMSDGVGWHKKWKREIFWKGKLPTGHRISWAPGAVLRRSVINPLKKGLGKTAVGKAVKGLGQIPKKVLKKAFAAVTKVAKQAAIRLLGLLKQIAAKLGLSGATQAVSQTIAQALAIVGDVFAPIVSHLIGFVAGIIIGVVMEWTWKLIKFAQKLTLYTCMSVGIGMVCLSGLAVITIGGALRLGGVGGSGIPGETGPFAVSKDVIVAGQTNPTNLDNSIVGSGATADYEITVGTTSGGGLSNVTVTDSLIVHTNAAGCSDFEVTETAAGNPIGPWDVAEITVGNPWEATFSILLDDPCFQDSSVVNTVTATDGVDTQTVSRTFTIGNPPVTECPLKGNHYVTTGCYRCSGGTESGHGSNSYWSAVGSSCLYGIPWLDGGVTSQNNSLGPTDTASPSCSNVCESQPRVSDHYGYAADVHSDELTVYLPSINGEIISWEKTLEISNNGGAWGYASIYYGEAPSGTQYEIYLGHINQGGLAGSNIPSGTAIGSLFVFSGGSSHLHLELQRNTGTGWEFLCPEFMCQ